MSDLKCDECKKLIKPGDKVVEFRRMVENNKRGNFLGNTNQAGGVVHLKHLLAPAVTMLIAQGGGDA